MSRRVRVRGMVIGTAVSVLAAGMAPAPAAAREVAAPIVGWEPSQVRTADGGPDWPESAPAPAVGQRGDEVVERRTRRSRTFELEGGGFETELFTGSVHHRAGGGWKPVDSRLVPDSAGGYVNAANRFSVRVPQTLAEPVRISRPGGWVSFRLVDVAPVRASVDGPTATFAGAWPGADVVWSVLADGVKEEVVLADVDSARPLVYDVRLAPGLELKAGHDGSLQVLDGEGDVVWRMPAPFMVDASQGRAGLSNDLTVDVAARGAGWRVTVTPSAAWLGDDARVWPVTIDPTVTVGGDSDCEMLAGIGSYEGVYEDNNYCGTPWPAAGRGSTYDSRAVFDFDVTGVIPAPAQVLSAELELTTIDWFGNSRPPLEMAALSTGFGSGMTWNDADSGVAWDMPGGDVHDGGRDTAPGTSTYVQDQVVKWYATYPVQRWLDGDWEEHGLRIAGNGDPGELYVYGVNHTSTQHHPRLVVRWHPQVVVGDSTIEVDLGGAGMGRVDVASGNFLLETSDGSLPGTAGMDLDYVRVYNHRQWDHHQGFGGGWTSIASSHAGTMRVYDAQRSVAYIHPMTGEAFGFVYDGAEWVPARRIEASLQRLGDGKYELTWHRSGRVERFQPWGQRLYWQDRNGNRISFGYDGSHRISSITDSQQRVTSVTRHASGNVAKLVDPASREHVYAYHTSGVQSQHRLASYTDPDSGVTTYDLNIFSQTGSVTDAEGNQTLLTFEPWDSVTVDARVLSITRVNPAGGDAVTSFAYHDDCLAAAAGTKAAACTVVTDPRGNDTVYYRNAKGQVTEVVDALGRERATTFDPVGGTVASVTNAHGLGLTTYTYSGDGRDNLESVAQDTGTGSTLTSTLSYADPDHGFLPSRYVAAQGTVVNYGYDTAGNLDCVNHLSGATDVCDYTGTPAAGQWQTDYNDDGTIDAVIDPNGNTTGYTWTYTTGGQLEELVIDHPAPRGDETVTFDTLGRVVSRVDGNTLQTVFAYDVLDRVVGVTFDDLSQVTYDYDATGNRTEMTDPHGTTTWDYDALGRLEVETLPDTTVLGYGYDPAGNLTAFTDPGGTVTYGYDDVNRPETVTDPGSGAQTTIFGYDDDVDGVHDRKTTSYPNGVVQTELVDQAGRLHSIEAVDGSSTLTSFTYAYEASPSDPATPLRASVTDHTADTTSYDYDGLDRLTDAVTRDPGDTIVDSHVYGYDDAGNRTTWTHNSVTTTYSYNNANQLTAAGSVTFSYDGAGNQTGSSAGQALTYNDADQTTSAKASSSSPTEDYTYAGTTQVHRSSIDTTPVVNAAHGVTRIGATGYTRTADATLVSLRSGSDRGYYLFDGLGSVAAVVDANGDVVNRYSYDPYGQTTTTCPTSSCLPNPWKYTGQHHDQATGLYKIGHRYYQPDHGRWTQPDPLGHRTNPVQPTETHPYAYVGCNPTNNTDPTGLITDEEKVQLIITGAITLLGLGCGIAIGFLTAGTTAFVVARACALAATTAGAISLIEQFARAIVYG